MHWANRWLVRRDRKACWEAGPLKSNAAPKCLLARTQTGTTHTHTRAHSCPHTPRNTHTHTYTQQNKQFPEPQDQTSLCLLVLILLGLITLPLPVICYLWAHAAIVTKGVISDVTTINYIISNAMQRLLASRQTWVQLY